MRGSTPLERQIAFPLQAPVTLAMRPPYLTFGTALKGAIPQLQSTDHLQPMMTLSEEHVTCTYPYQRF